MSVPRPAIWVDTVTVPSLPASAMTRGLLGVVLGVQHDGRARRALTSRSCSSSDSATSRVPTSTGCSVACTSAMCSTIAVVLGGRGDVDAVRLVLADVGRVRRDRRDAELVELAQLLAGGQRGAGHAAHRRVAVDQRLHGDGVEHLAGLGGLDALLGLDGGLQPVGPALQLRDAAAARR